MVAYLTTLQSAKDTLWRSLTSALAGNDPPLVTKSCTPIAPPNRFLSQRFATGVEYNLQYGLPGLLTNGSDV